MAAGVKVPPGWVDGWVRRAVETLAPAAAGDTSQAAAELAAVAVAREIAETGPELRRVEVEAGQPPDVVAARVGLPVAVVEAYAALFFAVADSATRATSPTW